MSTFQQSDRQRILDLEKNGSPLILFHPETVNVEDSNRTIAVLHAC